jgi:restriction system protein
LSRSKYPDYFPKEFDVEYLNEARRLIVDYELPSVEVMPRTREVKYVKTRNEFVEKYLTERQTNELYDSLCYQLCLRTVHEVIEADYIDVIHSVAFNGWVQFVSPETGKEVRSCILSIHVTKEQFLEINLAAVKPKACFRSLKGIGSAQLHKMAAVAPIATISRNDRRFVEDRAVLAKLGEGVNLACVHWEEFEHLVREVFGQEFSSDGGEVKITQSSRDGGIDAVAFDPDPIRGGKIVIQAKRYTNTVGVSAVRDLYGTLLNEGANKGILVTTSTFGSDAYEFIKGKPLSLLDGSNLLHLMERHGHKARIDIREAKTQQKAMNH